MKNKNNKPLILASRSPRRKKALLKGGYKFRTVLPDHRVEKRLRWGKRDVPSRYVIRAARAKAFHVAEKIKKGYVVAADTLIYDRGIIIEKPKTMTGAVAMLLRLSGRKHYVYTGLVVYDTESGNLKTGYEKSGVWIRRLTQDDIREYFKRVDPLDKAGAYAIQEHGARVVRKYTGSFDNIVGFPMKLFKKLFRQLYIEYKQ